MIAHGGLVGALAEILVLAAVAGVFAAVWFRERRTGGEAAQTGEAVLRDDDAR